MYNPVSCLHPHIIRNKYTGELVSVPCGRCSSCQCLKSALWIARCREESTCHRYTMFCTLTYDDAHLPLIDVNSIIDRPDSFYKSLNESKEFINFHNGLIPSVSISDIQKFFKLLRYYIVKNHGTQNTSIRYFLVSEYGPSSKRPHYHFLLWFDAPELVSTIKSYIYKAWQSKTCHKSLSAFLRRNKCVFVHGKAESYVAGYLNRFSDLPKILTEKPFRPWHVQSSAPPIGTIRILKESMERLLDGSITEISLHRLSTGSTVVIPMWRGLENRCFPKCIGFSKCSSSDRRTLYGISKIFGEEAAASFKMFASKFVPKWFEDDRPFSLVRKLCGDSSKDDTPSKQCLESLQRLFNVSKIAFSISESLGFTLDDFVERIEAYYSRKDYLRLVEQLRFEESLSNKKSNSPLSYYPFLIDSLFYENLRNLPSETYQSYLSQFGLGSCSDIFFTSSFSKEYDKRKSMMDKIYFDSRKVRIKKDYVLSHPERVYNYNYLLNQFKF